MNVVRENVDFFFSQRLKIRVPRRKMPSLTGNGASVGIFIPKKRVDLRLPTNLGACSVVHIFSFRCLRPGIEFLRIIFVLPLFLSRPRKKAVFKMSALEKGGEGGTSKEK